MLQLPQPVLETSPPVCVHSINEPESCMQVWDAAQKAAMWVFDQAKTAAMAAVELVKRVIRCIQHNMPQLNPTATPFRCIQNNLPQLDSVEVRSGLGLGVFTGTQWWYEYD